MNWTAEEQRAVGNALLGSWPGTITAWGKDAFAAYIAELEARGLTAERVLFAIRSWPAGTDFPPSAPNLAAAARRDPSKPVFDEMVALVFGEGGVLRARTGVRKASWEAGERARLDREAKLARLERVHPLVQAFVFAQGWLREKAPVTPPNLDDDEWGRARRAQLREAWEEFVGAHEGRDVAALVTARRGELGAFDPLAALGVRAPAGEIASGASSEGVVA